MLAELSISMLPGWRGDQGADPDRAGRCRERPPARAHGHRRSRPDEGTGHHRAGGRHRRTGVRERVDGRGRHDHHHGQRHGGAVRTGAAGSRGDDGGTVPHRAHRVRSAAKLALNAVLATLSQGIAEGLLVAEAGELDLKIFYDVLRASAAGAPYVGYKEAAFLSPASAGVAAPISLIRKDLGLALELAAGLDLPDAEAAYAVLDEATARGHGDEDMAQVLAALRLRNRPLSKEEARS